MVNPDDILNRKFEKHRGGYRPEEVDAYIAEVASVISRMKRDDAEQKRRYDALSSKVAQYESERSAVSDALLNAQKLADNILRDARTKAEIIEKDARGHADSLIGEIRGEITGEQMKLVGMKKEVSDFRSRMMEMYRAHLELINDMPVYHDEAQEQAAQETEEASPKSVEQVPEKEAEPVKAAEPETHEEQPKIVEQQETEQPVSAVSAQPFEPVRAEEPVRPAQPEVAQTAAPASEENDYINVMKSAFASTEPQPAEEAEPEPAEEKKAPVSGEAGKAPELKLNVRFDEETGEYLPINEPKHYDFNAFSSRK